jgi:2,4-dienoyl-CoA reductase-like NADH-dependent reductase (Old Yellow Enzyme family)
MAKKLRRLFEPITVGRLRLNNRLVMLAMTIGYAVNGRPTEQFKNFYAE